MIKGVIFDLRDTLIEVQNSYEECGDFLHKFINDHSFIINKERLQSDLLKIRKEVIKRIGKNTTIHNWDILFLNELFKKYQIKLSESQLEEFFKKYNNTFIKNLSLYPDAKVVLEYLKANGLKTGIVIDGTSSRERSVLAETGLDKLLDEITISEEVGQNKFSDKPLKDMIAKFGLLPESILVIGDRIDKDIIHANREGCVSVKLERPEGRYIDLNALTEDEKPTYIIHSLDLEEIKPLLK